MSSIFARHSRSCVCCVCLWFLSSSSLRVWQHTYTSSPYAKIPTCGESVQQINWTKFKMDGIPRTHEGNSLNQNLMNYPIYFSGIISFERPKSSWKSVRLENDEFGLPHMLFHTEIAIVCLRFTATATAPSSPAIAWYSFSIQFHDE